MCNAPITVNHSTGRHLVRCGACVRCAIRRQESWTLRCLLEAREHAYASFVTLTYREDTVPETLDRRDMQLFLKRLRRSTPSTVRYFYCGEYGGQTARPHWHVIVFGGQPLPKGWYELAAWPHGHAFVGTVEKASVAYVCRYTLKSWRGEHVIGMSTRPGIGLPAIRRMSGYMAEKMPHLEAFPSKWKYDGRFYFLDQRAYDVAKEAYLQAGGVLDEKPPAQREMEVELYRKGYRLERMESGSLMAMPKPSVAIDKFVKRYEQELAKERL